MAENIEEHLKDGEWATSIDLLDAYHHIPIHESQEIPAIFFQWQSFSVQSLGNGAHFISTHLLRGHQMHTPTPPCLYHSTAPIPQRLVNTWGKQGASQGTHADFVAHRTEIRFPSKPSHVGAVTDARLHFFLAYRFLLGSRKVASTEE